jgi:hypothetical protein
VHRLVLSPYHYDISTNSLLPALFDDIFTIGASAQRSIGVAAGALHAAGTEREAQKHAAGKSGTKYIGFCSAQASRIREEIRDPQVRDDPTRRICVYDTAAANDRFHADIFSAADLRTDKLLRQRLKNACVKLFSEAISLVP